MVCFACLPPLPKRIQSIFQKKPFYIEHQRYAFPDSMLQYILDNATSYIYFQLFNSCKSLKNQVLSINKKRVDELFIDMKKAKNEFILSKEKLVLKIGSNYNVYLEYLQPLKIKMLKIYEFKPSMFSSIFDKLDLINLRELHFVGGFISIKRILPLFLPSVTSLTFSPLLQVREGNLLEDALRNMPMLKSLTFGWQDEITNLSTATKIPRHTKLESLCIYDIPVYISPAVIADFISTQMAPSNKTCLGFFQVKKVCTEKEVYQLIQDENMKILTDLKITNSSALIQTVNLGVCVFVKVYLGIQAFNKKTNVTAEDVAAELLKHIKQKTEEFQGTKLNKAVITIPAAFTEAQKKATLEAAKLSGWENITLLPEPIAAAFAYFNDRPSYDSSNVLLFDLGGGTLDVCIFKTINNEIEITSNTGDSKFGGRDFDTVLINHFKNALLTEYGISLVKNKKYLLMVKCQKLKGTLSLTESCSLDVDDFDTTQDGIITINQEEFKKMCEPLLNKVRNTIQSALFESNYKPEQIDKVLHVGGGSRMPMIKQQLQQIFPNADHCCEEHPDEVVAMGASYYAYSIF